jgi:hypothetical protein
VFSKYRLLILLLLASFLLRLPGINQSLWLDETISANAARLPLNQLSSEFLPRDFHPPLYSIFLHYWIIPFGYSEISLRIPSVIFSLLAIFYLYRLSGLWPAIFLSVNPLFVYYSQEARSYSLVVFLVAAFLFYFRRHRHLLASIFVLLSLFTFYGVIFFYAAILVYLLFRRHYRRFFGYSFVIIFSLALLSPLLSRQLQHGVSEISTLTNWSSALGQTNIKNLLLIPLKFSVGRISFQPKIFYYLLSGFWSFIVFFTFFVTSRRSFSLFIFITTLFFATIISFFLPQLFYFRFLYLLPLLSLGLPPNRLYVIVFLVFSLLYLFFPIFHREDWRSLSQSLTSPVYLIPSFADPLIYYRPDLKIESLTACHFSSPSVSVIPYGQAIHSLNLSSCLGGYELKKTTYFRGLEQQIWQKQP